MSKLAEIHDELLQAMEDSAIACAKRDSDGLSLDSMEKWALSVVGDFEVNHEIEIPHDHALSMVRIAVDNAVQVLRAEAVDERHYEAAHARWQPEVRS